MTDVSVNSMLSLFETDKARRTSVVNQIVAAVEDGQLDPLKVHLQVKCMEDIVTQLTSADAKKNKNVAAANKFRSLVLDTAMRNGQKFTLYNAEFSIKETGTKYDYTVCEDVVWNELAAQAEDIKKKLAEREKFLQAVPASGIADPDNGNMIYRASKSSTTSVSVSLK